MKNIAKFTYWVMFWVLLYALYYRLIDIAVIAVMLVMVSMFCISIGGD